MQDCSTSKSHSATVPYLRTMPVMPDMRPRRCIAIRSCRLQSLAASTPTLALALSLCTHAGPILFGDFIYALSTGDDLSLSWNILICRDFGPKCLRHLQETTTTTTTIFSSHFFLVKPSLSKLIDGIKNFKKFPPRPCGLDFCPRRCNFCPCGPDFRLCGLDFHPCGCGLCLYIRTK
jgi:hypothetical protein